MIYIENKSKNPYFNLALEEYLISNYPSEETIFLLWQNENTIVIGRNQNVYSEINLDLVRRDNVNLVRRLTGGGAVYHDEGNLNFSFIFNNKNINYQQALQPIIDSLKELGINASFVGKNDIEVNGKKISGNSQYIYRDRLLHHGTILFNVNLLKLNQYLNVNKLKMKSKGVKSVSARVTNIYPLLKKKITIEQFTNHIISFVLKQNSEKVILNQKIIKEVKKLEHKKYDKWNWNYGKQLDFQIKNQKRFENKGTVEVYLNVNNQKIMNIRFYGDFLGTAGKEQLEKKLKHKRFNHQEIEQILKQQNLGQIFGANFEVNDILLTIFNE